MAKNEVSARNVVYVLTEDVEWDWEDCTDEKNRCRVFLSIEKARRALRKIYKEAKSEDCCSHNWYEEYHDENGFSLYEKGLYSNNHFDAHIFERRIE